MADFGRDISCTSELRTGRFVSGNRLVAEAIYRRLTTPRGMLVGGEEEADYGLDLTELIGGDARLMRSLPGRIRNELLKDERIEDATVTTTTVQEGAVLTVDFEIAVTTAEGPFDLTLRVSELTVELVGLTA